VKPLRDLQHDADLRSGSRDGTLRWITATALLYRMRPSVGRHQDLARAVLASLRAAGHAPSLRRSRARA
jgi:hypothetical protein